MTVSLIVAMTKDKVIGKNNQLPWHLSEDLKRFKKITMGHPIIMGRKTFESIGRPLPGRQNIVLTHNKTYKKEGVTVAQGLEDALSKCESSEEAFIIGGSAVFQAAFPKINRLYLTLIDHPFEGDTYFPNVDLETQFTVKEKTRHQTGESGGFSYDFIVADRV